MIIALAYIANIDFIKAKGFIPSYGVLFGSLLIWRFLWRGFTGEYIKPKPQKVLIFKNGDSIENHKGFEIVKEIKLSDINSTISNSIFKNNKFDGILIESNGHLDEEILNVISKFAETEYEIYVSPKLYPLVYQHFLVAKIPDSPLLRIIFHPLSTWDRFLKRVTDIILSILSLITLSPILVIVALFIKLDSRGPVFYKQRRVGFRGKKFTLYKFRSMITDAEKYTGPVWAEKNDRRITNLGKIIRPLRLDELPQLFNVLMGNMSFVGPRPERPHFVARFKKEISLYNLRLSVFPGITGLSQVRHNYDRTMEDVQKKLDYDLEYINNLSLQLDLKIFFKTILTVLKREGAH